MKTLILITASLFVLLITSETAVAGDGHTRSAHANQDIQKGGIRNRADHRHTSSKKTSRTRNGKVRAVTDDQLSPAPVEFMPTAGTSRMD